MGSLINDDYPIQLSSAPFIDFSILLNQDSRIKNDVIKEIGKACQDFGFFSIINHGIGESLIEDVMDANSRFFDMPIEEKKELLSNDVYKPVRFETFIQDDKENGKLTREFLKLYAHPIGDWIGSWPGNPPDYRYLKFLTFFFLNSVSIKIRTRDPTILKIISISTCLSFIHKLQEWKIMLF
ncbi:flavanone 3-dioxygenase 3 [Hevea brasiliensis]|uniref:flavanone 3-dioxygenase 3 n=1 Tax=Hevea brasiliensis TaxID=3981 RepID=UPI0025ECA799|nr:flavanone 3-dioxygenase 3 [Hevea brasiliensis]